MKVLFIWEVPDTLKKHFRGQLPDSIDLIFPDCTEEENLCRLVKGVEAIVGWRPTRRLLETADDLKLFQNPGAGVERLVPLFREFPDITLCNCHGNAYLTAQHAVALLLSLSNRVTVHHNFMKRGVWRTGDEEAKSITLRSKTLGLLGYGNVGRKVARFLSGFELDMIACKRNVESDPALDAVYGQNQLDEFLRHSDILVASLPLTDETEGLLGSRRLSLLGEEGLLVNVGRGAVIEQRALFEALREGHIAGAALDVWYDYDPEPDEDGKRYPYKYPFHRLENVVLSPHRGASPKDDIARWREVIENLKRLYQGEELLNVVSTRLGY